MVQEVSIFKYVLRFSLAYLVLILVLVLLLNILGIKLNHGASIVALIAAAVLTVSKFLQDNKRIPTASEKTKLVWFSFLASWLVVLMPFGAAGAAIMLLGAKIKIMKDFRIEDIPITVGLAIVFAVFDLVGLYISYGFLARKKFEVLQKKDFF